MPLVPGSWPERDLAYCLLHFYYTRLESPPLSVARDGENDGFNMAGASLILEITRARIAIFAQLLSFMLASFARTIRD